MTIMRPRSPHLSRPGTTVTLVLVWTISVILAIPTLVYSTTVSYGEDMVKQREACLMIWPDGDPRLDSSSLTDSRYDFYIMGLSETMNQPYSVSEWDHYYQVGL